MINVSIKIDCSKFQVKAKTPDGYFVVGYINRHRGDAIFDECGNQINPGDFYVFVWHEKVDTGIYGKRYAVEQDSIELAPSEECI